ncbi:hypothetical protein CHS0354_002428 [Potamilus streckersoni]|uniref:Uncharacterized protein n=1 Tax=Potamilus streckersoni TaxID=2493646 RepID=A0AAE0T8P4_9BIVA|nr:hypothetical protein CHS0354_002428 [Potamilus streckersoni]
MVQYEVNKIKRKWAEEKLERKRLKIDQQQQHLTHSPTHPQTNKRTREITADDEETRG